MMMMTTTTMMMMVMIKIIMMIMTNNNNTNNYINDTNKTKHKPHRWIHFNKNHFHSSPISEFSPLPLGFVAQGIGTPKDRRVHMWLWRELRLRHLGGWLS